MIDQAQTDKLSSILTSVKSILVIFPPTQDLDLFLASYALFTFLNFEHETRLLTPEFKVILPKTLSNLVDLQLIEKELGKENLLVSFPYQAEQVDKVSYYIDENDKRFYLTIKPKKGVLPLDSAALEFTYAGAQVDLLLLCGVEQLADLAQLYVAYEHLYQGTDNQVVTINDFIPDFGQLNLDISPGKSYCEAVFALLKELPTYDENFLAKSNLPTLLLYGIETKTHGLKDTDLDANLFYSVAELLRLGALRLFAKTTASPIKAPKKTKAKVAIHPQKH